MANYYISDLHYGHENIIKICNRPFNTVEEMNKSIVDVINNTCGEEDILYHIGDISMKKKWYEELASQLKCKLVCINGNHDKRFVQGEDILEITEHKKLVVLCHYPMYSWNKAHYGSIHLYGHTHAVLRNLPPKAYCVCYDVICKPMTLAELVDYYEPNFL